MENAHSRRAVMVGAVATVTALAFTRMQARAKVPVVHEIKIKAFAFTPELLTVSVGDTIRWTNEDLAPHTATADEFGWDTEEIVNGAFAEMQVTEDMETTYFCAFHPHMKGTLVVL